MWSAPAFKLLVQREIVHPNIAVRLKPFRYFRSPPRARMVPNAVSLSRCTSLPPISAPRLLIADDSNG